MKKREFGLRRDFVSAFTAGETGEAGAVEFDAIGLVSNVDCVRCAVK